jgi:hypothetical protein
MYLQVEGCQHGHGLDHIHSFVARGRQQGSIHYFVCAGASGSASKYDIERSKIIRAETISEYRVSAVGWKRGIVRKGKMSGG